MGQNSRRIFIKSALVATGVATVALGSRAVASSDKKNGRNGVVSGKSNKNEILYKKTQTWEEYYKTAL